MKAFLVLILLFSALPGSYNAIFAVTYAAMLPYSCVAYDERSKWDQLAAMMPYSNRDLVLSRYILAGSPVQEPACSPCFFRRDSP
mgnify:CR=1 FL=1